MKLLRYDSAVDALYIDLSNAPVADTQEVQPGVLVDYDARQRIIGIEILDFQARLNQEVEPNVEEVAPSSLGIAA